MNKTFFKRFCLFLESREREGEIEGEKRQCVVASYTPSPTWGLAHNPGTCADWESNWQSNKPVLNPLSHTSQG